MANTKKTIKDLMAAFRMISRTLAAISFPWSLPAQRAWLPVRVQRSGRSEFFKCRIDSRITRKSIYFILCITSILLLPSIALSQSSYRNVVTTQYPSAPNYCGLCHFDWTGQGSRNNFAIMRYRQEGAVNPLGATEKAWDPDFDSSTSDTELTAGKFPGWPDKDGDNYIALYYRIEESGTIPPIQNAPGGAPSGVLGWDVDDNDATKGNIAWGTNPTGSETDDTTPPAAINNMRVSALGSAQINLQWTAPGDDDNTGTAHLYDIRYTTQTIINNYNGQNGTSYNLREPSDWGTMWNRPDCNVDGRNTNVLPQLTPGNPTPTSCNNNSPSGWNTGDRDGNPLMRVVLEPLPQAAGTTQSKTISSVGTTYSTNAISNGTLYWTAMRASDGVVMPQRFQWGGTTYSLLRENISPVSNIIAMTAGASGTGVAIQSFNSGQYSVTVMQQTGQSFTVQGVGFNLINSARLNNVSGGNSVNCTISGKTDTSMTLTCDTSGLPYGYYDVDILNGATLRAAWVDVVRVTTNATVTDAATASIDSLTSIAISMPYSQDANANNTYTVDYKLSTDGSWTNWVTNAAHTASPYTTTITGLIDGETYDVRVTYNDADGVSGTNPQTAIVNLGAINVRNVSASPNPFNPNPPVNQTTTISYSLANNALMWLRIYDTSDVLKRRLVDPATFTTTNKNAGSNSEIWDGRDDASVILPDGNYPYRIDDIAYISQSAGTGGSTYDVVVDPTNDQVMWASRSGVLRKSTNGGSTWATINYGGNDPRGMDITSDGQTIWLADGSNSRVYRSTNGGTNWSQVNWTGINRPQDIGVTADGAVAYGVDESNRRVYRYTGSWSETTAQPTGINSPSGVAVHPLDSSIVYVADYGAQRVWVSTDGGASWTQFASSGTASDTYNRPYDVEVDMEGYVWITDRTYHRIQKFKSDGTWLMTVGGTASGNGNYQFNSGFTALGAHAVSVDGGLRLYIADYNNQIIKRYRYDNWTSPTFLQITTNIPPTLSISQPDGVGDTVNSGSTYNITYSLADSDNVVTAAFYYDTNNTGLDGTAISTGSCDTAPEGTNVTCPWDTTGVPAGSYYVYGITSDGVNAQVSAYSPGMITIVDLTTVGNGTNPSNANLAPGGSATMLDAFTLQTTSGTDTVTAVTVSLSAGSSGGLSLVEITNDAGGTVYGSVSNPASDTPNISLTTNITANTTLTQYKVRITPKSHVNMPAPSGSTYTVTGTVTAITSSYTKSYNDSGSATITIDNLSPGNHTSVAGTRGNAQVSLSWSNPADSDYSQAVVLRRASAAVGDTPTEGSSYSVGNTIGSSTVACVVASPGTSCTDTGLTNGTDYYYKIFAKDTNGNYSSGGTAAGPYTPATGPFTDIGNGTNPSNANLAPGGSATMLDAFTLQTTSGTDTVTAVTVSLSAGSSGGLSLVEITNDAGGTVYGSVSNPASDTPNISLTTNITANTTLTQYKVRITPKSHVNMPAPSGSTYTVTGTVTAVTSANTKNYSDTSSATITIDNLSPSNHPSLSGVEGNTQVALSWSNPADSDYSQAVVLRRASAAVGDTPTEGSSYSVGNTIGSSTVACVVASPGTSCTDTGLTNGTAYYYKIFAKDTNGNYSSGGTATGPHTPDPDTTAPAASTLNLAQSYTRGLRLSWTAPGDDNTTGTAISYDFRFADAADYSANMTAAYFNTNWSTTLMQAQGEPTPQTAGSSEYFDMAMDTLNNKLTPNTLYYIAMKATDDRGNISALSNILTAQTAMRYGHNSMTVPYSTASTLNTLFSDDVASVYVMKWTSSGLDSGGTPQGGWSVIDSGTVPSAGTGYWLYAYGMNSSVPDVPGGTSENAGPVIVYLQQGWNDIGNPYLKNVAVNSSNVYICNSVIGTVTGWSGSACTGTGTITTNTFADAVTAGWIANSIYYYANNSTWESEIYTAAKLRPWWGQRVYISAADASTTQSASNSNYYIVIIKP